ncbi:MAG: sugar porter family MFS transporter [Chitinophagales bacterium]
MQNNNNKTLFWSITVALAGFLFGFDTVVISGANLPIKELWQTSPWFHGTFIMSMALWGTVLGSLLGGIPCDKLGRKKTLFWIGVLYFISAVGSGLATDPYLFSFFRFIGGIGVGASSVAAPIYISEISSAEKRGQLVALYQFNIVFGIFIAFISNAAIAYISNTYFVDATAIIGKNGWRIMLAIEGLPALIYILMVMKVPNSPRWLILQKRDDVEGKSVLTQLFGAAEAEHLLVEIKKDLVSKTETIQFFSKKYSLPITLAFLLAFFNQLSGINFVLYYAAEILENAGFASQDSLMSSISIGGVNLIFTLLGMYLIDRAGRKQLMLIGSIGYIVSLGMVSYGFYSAAAPTFTLTFILMFIASHAIGQGAVIWVFISEIFPNNVRASGQSFGTGTHWVFAALITLFGSVIMNSFEPWKVYAFFAGFMVLQLLFVIFMMPETKGVSLEEIEKKMIKE